MGGRQRNEFRGEVRKLLKGLKEYKPRQKPKC